MNLSLDSQLYSCWVGAQLPIFLAYACRREDIDFCVDDYGRGVPFHSVKMMAARKVLPGRRHITVATAAYIVPGPPGQPRRVCLDLISRKSINIYTVPANDSRSVRAQLRAHGLRRRTAYRREYERMYQRMRRGAITRDEFDDWKKRQGRE